MSRSPSQVRESTDRASAVEQSLPPVWNPFGAGSQRRNRELSAARTLTGSPEEPRLGAFAVSAAGQRLMAPSPLPTRALCSKPSRPGCAQPRGSDARPERNAPRLSRSRVNMSSCLTAKRRSGAQTQRASNSDGFGAHRHVVLAVAHAREQDLPVPLSALARLGVGPSLQTAHFTGIAATALWVGGRG